MNNKRKAKKAEIIGDYYYWKKNNFKLALKNYLRAISFYDSRQYFKEELYHNIAHCYGNLGKPQLENEYKYISKCLEISPGYLDGKIYKGNLLIRMGKKEEGEKILADCEKEEEKIKNMHLDLDAFYNTK